MNRNAVIQTISFQGEKIKYNHHEYDTTGSFQEAIGTILAIAQFCGIMPVFGVRNKSAAKLYYEWNSFRMIYSFIIACVLSGWAAMSFGVCFISEINFPNMISVIFYASATCGIWSFCNLARKWPNLMIYWQSVESKMPRYRSRKESGRMASRIKLYAICFCICAAIEHILTVISDIFYVTTCRSNVDPFTGYLQRQTDQLFSITHYKLWKGLLAKAVNIIAAFVWNYMNIFIIMICIGISTRIKQFNDELFRNSDEFHSEDYWEYRRAQYRKIAALCETVDKAVAPITIIALANNLFFVCVQLMKSLRPMASVAHAVYFWFSLTFLLTRTLVILLFAATIHDESKRPIKVLRSVPKKMWCTEIERFMEEINHAQCVRLRTYTEILC